MADKKIPMRQCIALCQQFPKKDMFRIVKTPTGEIQIDLKGKVNGRGAYISKSKEAINVCKNKKVLEKKLEASIPDDIYDRLLELISE